MRTFIVGGTVLTPSRELPGYTVVVEKGAIQAVLAARPQPGPVDQVIDASAFFAARAVTTSTCTAQTAATL
jgi:imidazolonepropionase-like amidohydrolase